MCTSTERLGSDRFRNAASLAGSRAHARARSPSLLGSHKSSAFLRDRSSTRPGLRIDTELSGARPGGDASAGRGGQQFRRLCGLGSRCYRDIDRLVVLATSHRASQTRALALDRSHHHHGGGGHQKLHPEVRLALIAQLSLPMMPSQMRRTSAAPSESSVARLRGNSRRNTRRAICSVASRLCWFSGSHLATRPVARRTM